MAFFSCGHDADGSTRRAAAGEAGARRHRVIDIHCHMQVPQAAEIAKPHVTPRDEPSAFFASPESRAVNHDMIHRIRAQITTAEAKIADMDRLGVDVQVLSPAPVQYYYWAEPDLGRETSRLVNDRIAEVVAAHPDRFAGLGTLPMQAPDLAVAELRRAMRDLGLRGFELGTNVAGAELDDPRFAPVFAAAEDLGALIFLHPMGFTHADRLTRHYLNNVIGNPLETTIAVSHLIFGGVLDRHPGLKICLAHGGGYLAAYSGRMDHAWRERADCRVCRRTPSAYLRDFYYDTVVFDRDQLEHLVARYGADRILLGSDHPFDMGDPDPVAIVAALRGLDPDDLSKILGGNAARLLALADGGPA